MNQPPNYDPETGVHYGVISQHSVHPECLWPNEGWEDEGWNDLLEETQQRVEELAVEMKEFQKWAEELGVLGNLPDFPEEAELIEAIVENVEFGDSNGPWTYAQDGYVLRSTETEIFVIKSPWVKYCRPCSPCFPNAGNLDDPDIDYGIKTYCLGPEWFENDKPLHDEALEEVENE